MMQPLKRLCVSGAWLAAIGMTVACAGSAVISIDTERPGPEVSPMLWGIFFEEINCAGDGGLYAELVRNRSFEDTDQPAHWVVVPAESGGVSLAVDTKRPLNPFNRRSLRVDLAGATPVGVANEGYWGVALKEGQEYLCRFAVRASTNGMAGVRVRLEGAGGTVHAEGDSKAPGVEWEWRELRLTSKGTDPRARLVLGVQGPGSLWLDMVSLVPVRTWKGRANGLREDLAGMLEELHPAFVRFPGGCWVEGQELSGSYRWKETLGDVAVRRTQYNLWQYSSTHGLGYHEYLLLCEDLRAEPLFVINCGMSHTEVVPLDRMAEWVQDALDAVEYANGATNTVWGGLRARNGHPAPFGLKYLEIGNENGGPAYHERFALFHDALKARFPEVRLVANEWGGQPTNRPVDIVDEHYYNTPEFFLAEADRYDRYDRKGPRVYVGEYAVTAGCGQGNLRAAVGEAAFMTGLERNSDVVVMASYAPLFANVNYKKWNPDLINFDSARVYGTPSYWVQRMFSVNRGDVVLPVTLEQPDAPADPARPGAIGVGTWLTQAEFKDLKVTKGNEVLFTSDFARGTNGWTTRGGQWTVQSGAFRQSGDAENVQAVAGDTNWVDYVYSLKARKLGGAEGFLVMFQVQGEGDWTWWNLGGWGNHRHAIERSDRGGKSTLGNPVDGQIEVGRWYDVRVEVQGSAVRCFLDGRKIHDVVYPRPRPLHASAVLDRKRGEVVVKVVNAAAKAESVTLRPRKGGFAVGGQALQAEILTSASPMDENTLDAPLKVAPRRETHAVGPDGAVLELPGNSVSVLRLKTR